MQNIDPTVLPHTAVRLRTPLAALCLSASQLLPAPLREKDPALDRQAAMMDRSCFRLLRLAGNLSLLHRLDTHEALPLRDADIVALTGEVCGRITGLASLLGIHVRFLCAPPRHICGFTPDTTEQLLYHLLSNALKATPSGGTVTVALRFTQKRVLLSVTDTGTGISEDRLPLLLASDPTGGTGLGLAICQRIAARQGGVLLAQSRKDKGSRFTLSLPDRRCGAPFEPLPFDPTGGFNPTLVALSDVLPPEAFLLRCRG